MDQPLLLLPRLRTLDREIKGGGGPELPPLRSKEEQRKFLDERFDRLEQRFRKRPGTLQRFPSGMRPEEVLVVTLRGEVDRLQEALAAIPGIEFFFDFAGGEADGDEEVAQAENARVYIASTDDRALEQLEQLYRWYKKFDGRNMAYGQTPFRDLFNQIEEIRYWNASDRLENTNVIPYLRSQVDAHVQTIPIEFQFWFRDNSSRRRSIEVFWEGMTREHHGEVVRKACIPEIRYHAMLLRLPRTVVADILERKDTVFISESSLWLLQEVGQSIDSGETAQEPIDHDGELASITTPMKAPIAVLLDTLPVANHPALQGLIEVDDPDGWAHEVAVAQRAHGTAMASLIARGDLQIAGDSIGRKLLAVPVLKPVLANPCAFPDDELFVDLLHRRIRELMEGPNGETILVVNLSLGDPHIPLDRTVSTIGRIVDYLAFKYRLLFIISAGNASCRFSLPDGVNFPSLSIPELAAHALKAAASARASRRIISPADSINGLTISALYDDGSTDALPSAFRLLSESPFFPATYSREGAGFRRSIKPDMAMPGGRLSFREGALPRSISETTNRPGQRVAHSDGKFAQMCGTSNSAALATRQAHFGYEVLEQLRVDEGYEIPRGCEAVLLKALLANSAGLEGVIDALTATGLSDQEALELALLTTGYGGFNDQRFARCADHRAIMIGFGELTVDRADEYTVPIPASLAGTAAPRRLSLTLAYLAPINTTRYKYRKARLSIEVRQPDLAAALGVNAARPDRNIAARGTLQQLVFEGNTIVANPEGHLRVQVECRDHAGLEMTERIPYALVVNLEVQAESGIPLYADTRAAIAAVRASLVAPAAVASPTPKSNLNT